MSAEDRELTTEERATVQRRIHGLFDPARPKGKALAGMIEDAADSPNAPLVKVLPLRFALLLRLMCSVAKHHHGIEHPAIEREIGE